MSPADAAADWADAGAGWAGSVDWGYSWRFLWLPIEQTPRGIVPHQTNNGKIMTFIGNNAGAALAVWQHSETIYLGGNGDFPPDTLATFANSQFAYGAQIGVDPTIYMFAALGVGEITAALATRKRPSLLGRLSAPRRCPIANSSVTHTAKIFTASRKPPNSMPS